MFWVFGHQACETLAPLPRTEPALEGKVLTIGPPGKYWLTPNLVEQNVTEIPWGAQYVTFESSSFAKFIWCGLRDPVPLQYSCLENPRDGGAWWAAVYGVAQSRTQLKWLSSSSSSSASYVILFSDVSKWGCFYCQVMWVWRKFFLSVYLPCERRMSLTSTVSNCDWTSQRANPQLPGKVYFSTLEAVSSSCFGTTRMLLVSIYPSREGPLICCLSLLGRNLYKTNESWTIPPVCYLNKTQSCIKIYIPKESLHTIFQIHGMFKHTLQPFETFNTRNTFCLYKFISKSDLGEVTQQSCFSACWHFQAHNNLYYITDLCITT